MVLDVAGQVGNAAFEVFHSNEFLALSCGGSEIEIAVQVE